MTPASSTVLVSAVNGWTYARSAFVAAMTSFALDWLFQKSPDACCASSSASFARRSSMWM